MNGFFFLFNEVNKYGAILRFGNILKLHVNNFVFGFWFTCIVCNISFAILDEFMNGKNNFFFINFQNFFENKTWIFSLLLLKKLKRNKIEFSFFFVCFATRIPEHQIYLLIFHKSHRIRYRNAIIFYYNETDITNLEAGKHTEKHTTQEHNFFCPFLGTASISRFSVPIWMVWFACAKMISFFSCTKKLVRQISFAICGYLIRWNAQ